MTKNGQNTRAKYAQIARADSQNPNSTKSFRHRFTPLIASSLALALSASSMNALALQEAQAKTCASGSNVCIFNGTASNLVEKTNLNIDWQSVNGGLFKPSYNNTGATPATGEVENIIFDYYQDNQDLEFGSYDTGSKTITLKAPQWNQDHLTTLIQGGSNGIQMGANGQGTLTIKFNKEGGNRKRDFTLDLSKTTGTTSFKGNIEIFGGKGTNANDSAHFNAYFGKNVEGNISIKSHVNSGINGHSFSNFTFLNGAKLTGSIDAQKGTNTFNFEGNRNEITGDVVLKSDGYGSNLIINFNGTEGVIGGRVRLHPHNGAITIQGSGHLTINANSLRIEKGMLLGENALGSNWGATLNLSGANNFIGKIYDDKGTATSDAIKLTHNLTLNINERKNKPFDLTIDGNIYFNNSGKGSFLVNAPSSTLTINGGVSSPADINHMFKVDVKKFTMTQGFNISTGDVSIKAQNFDIQKGITVGGNAKRNTTFTFEGNGVIGANGSGNSIENTQHSNIKSTINLIGTSSLTLKGAISVLQWGKITIQGEQAILKGTSIKNQTQGDITINVKTLALSEGISTGTAGHAYTTNNITLNGGDSSIGGNITTGEGANNFTLNSTDANTPTTLTLNGATNQISTLKVTGTNNALNLANTSNTTTIGTLDLDGSHLNINNKSSNVTTNPLEVVNLNLSNGGQLITNTTSKLTNLNVVGTKNVIGGNVTAGKLAFADSNSEIGYSGNLTITNIDEGSNQGTFIATNGGGTSNLLTINSGIGTYTFKASKMDNEAEFIYVAETSEYITLTDGKYDDGDKEIKATISYKLDTATNRKTWYAKLNEDVSSSRTQSSQDISASFLNVYLANFNSLNKRMGELRDNKNGQGAWGRIFNGQEKNKFSNSSTNFTTIQAGYDYAFGLGEGVTNYLGAALSYGFGSSGFDQAYGSLGKTSDMTSHLVEFALYNSYVQDEGWFNDTIIKFGSLMNNISSTGLDVKTNSFAFTFSDEVGYRFKLGSEKEWFIDPQFELGMGHLADAKFDNGNYQVNADSMFVLRTRLGASAGYDFKKLLNGNTIKASAYVGLFAEIDSFNGGNLALASTNAKVLSRNANTQFKSTDARAVINYGGNVAVKDNIRVYLDMEHSFGGQISTDYKINAGVRYSFGEKAQFLDTKAREKKDEAKKKEETPLKLKEEEKKNAQEQAKDVKAEEKQTAKSEKAEAKKTESKKADAKAEKKPAKKQATKKQTTKKQPAKKQAQAKKGSEAKKPVKKAEANKTKSANKTAQTEGRKDNGWGWW